MRLGSTSASFSFSSYDTELNSELLSKLCGYDENHGNNWELSFKKTEQIRKHKKKRINKKWAKKYGYRDIIIPLGNFKPIVDSLSNTVVTINPLKEATQ